MPRHGNKMRRIEKILSCMSMGTCVGTWVSESQHQYEVSDLASEKAQNSQTPHKMKIPLKKRNMKIN